MSAHVCAIEHGTCIGSTQMDAVQYAITAMPIENAARAREKLIRTDVGKEGVHGRSRAGCIRASQ